MREQINKHFITIITIFVFLISFFTFSNDHVLAESSFTDGTYSVDYEILRGDNDSVSIANDYFEKPATLIVENGEEYIQFWLNHSQWVQELQAPLGDDFVDVTIVEENEIDDLRLVQFKVDRDLTVPIEFKMHVYIDSMEPVYDHRYTVRFDFDLYSLEEIDSVQVFRAESSDNAADKQAQTEEVDEADATENLEDEESATDVAETVEADDTSISNANASDNSSNFTVILVVIIVLLIVGIIAIVFAKKRKDKTA